MRIIFAIPGDLTRRTGGYGYDRRVMKELVACGVEVDRRVLPAAFPQPSHNDVEETVRIISDDLRPNDVIVIDGLAYGALPGEAIRKIFPPLIALCHHPLALEAGLGAERADILFNTERSALALAAHVVTTSAHTRDALMRVFSVPACKITVASPGTDRASRATGSGGVPMLLALGSIIPRKAFELLVEALHGIRDLAWRLRIVGSMTDAPETANALRHLIEIKGLGARIDLLGQLCDRKLDQVFKESDVFVSASLYEGYGMALAEAMARGLPVVTTTGGAAAETVPDLASLKVRAGDVFSLRTALRTIIADARLRERLAKASWTAGQTLPRWQKTAEIIAAAATPFSRETR